MVESVQLFITCILDTLYPEIGRSVVLLLEHLGVRAAFPLGQTCCGQPAFNAGMRAQARPVAQHTIATFEKTEGPIVVPSGSCAAMVRHGYLELFRNDDAWFQRAERMAGKTFELTEFIVDYLGVTDVGARYEGTFTYHASCHLLRDLGVSRQPLLLLSHIEGARFVELPASNECCGFGGVFSVEHPEVSNAMLDAKIENIEKSASPLVVSSDAGCITQMNGGLRRRGKPQRAVHIAQLLANQVQPLSDP